MAENTNRSFKYHYINITTQTKRKHFLNTLISITVHLVASLTGLYPTIKYCVVVICMK